MKKLVLMLAVAFSMTLFSCGQKAETAEAEAPAEEVVEVVEEATAPVEEAAAEATDSAAAVVEEVVEAAPEAAPAE